MADCSRGEASMTCRDQRPAVSSSSEEFDEVTIKEELVEVVQDEEQSMYINVPLDDASSNSLDCPRVEGGTYLSTSKIEEIIKKCQARNVIQGSEDVACNGGPVEDDSSDWSFDETGEDSEALESLYHPRVLRKCPPFSKFIAHPTKKVLKCSECGHKFPFRYKVSLHLKSPITELTFICKDCGKSFNSKRSVYSHLRTHTARTFICHECRKCFVEKRNLVVHLRIHSGEKPYSCDICGKAFSQNSMLKIHYRIHSGERPHACTECGVAFYMRSKLVEHIRTHTNEKPYLCSECGKSFRLNKVFTDHLRVHSNDRPFTCPECGKSFKRKTHLRTHSRIHSNLRPFICDTCGKGFKYKAVRDAHTKVHSQNKQTVLTVENEGEGAL